MNTIIPVSTLRENLATALDAITNNKEYLLIKNRNKITSAIVDIDLFEDLLAAANHKYLETIKTAREQYRKGQVYSHDEVFGAL
ncbi:MAG TPA: type II toxin-antitoxin system Phd/YefM family antitoxin [bacterium]|nr:type II toxin-antitoxin system Phd/YefM family antitoxin [bacterium]